MLVTTPAPVVAIVVAAPTVLAPKDVRDFISSNIGFIKSAPQGSEHQTYFLDHLAVVVLPIFLFV